MFSGPVWSTVQRELSITLVGQFNPKRVPFWCHVQAHDDAKVHIASLLQCPALDFFRLPNAADWEPRRWVNPRWVFMFCKTAEFSLNLRRGILHALPRNLCISKWCTFFHLSTYGYLPQFLTPNPILRPQTECISNYLLAYVAACLIHPHSCLCFSLLDMEMYWQKTSQTSLCFMYSEVSTIKMMLIISLCERA